MRSTLFFLFIFMFVGWHGSAFAQNALDFDGSDDYVQTSKASISGNTAKTIEAWVKTTANANPSQGGVQKVIADMGTFTTGGRFTLNVLWSNSIRLEVGGSGLSGTTAINDGNWHHVAGVYDPNATNKFKLYIDGNLEAEGNITTTVNTGSSGNFRIGRRMDNANYFDGSIDEVRLWDVARSAAQISANMNSEFCSPDSHLVAYYKLNEGTASGTNTGLTSAYDASGNGNNGTLNGYALQGSSSNWVAGVNLTTSVLTSSLSVTGCDGSYTSPSGNYTWTTSGTYIDTINSVTACDSIITIDLNFASSSSSQFQVTECDSYTSPSGNYTWSTSGTYHDTIPNAAGCDSVMTIAVEILNTSSYQELTACDSFTLPSGQQTVHFSGLYYDTIANTAGCDSLLTMLVTIVGPSYESMNATACLSYTSPSGNHTWITSGTYYDTLTNALACDSILTIFLTIQTVNVGVTQSGTLLSAQASGAAYQWIDCGSNQAISGATGKLFSPSSSGSYAVVVTQSGCTDTSDCFNVEIVGIAKLAPNRPLLYPNPSNGAVIIKAAQSDVLRAVKVINTLGQTVYESELSLEPSTQILFALPPAHYTVMVQTAQGNFMLRLAVE